MNQAVSIVDTIQFRFYSYLIGLDYAKQAAGIDLPPRQQGVDANRKLLRVEQIASRDKNLNQKSKQSYQDSLRDNINEQVEHRMLEEFNEAESLLGAINFDERITDVLDILNVRAASISRIEPLVSAISWLKEDVLKFVNLPQYRKTDKYGNSIRVDNLRLAMSYIGLENLKMVIPSFAIRQCLPHSTGPFPSLKKKLWEHALGSALACRKIAEVTEQDQGHAFAMGLFHDVGKGLIVRAYLRIFDQTLLENMEDAESKKRQQEFDGLQGMHPSGEFLRHLLLSYSRTLAARIVEEMDFKRLMITPPLREYAEVSGVAKMSPMTRLLAQGNVYSEFRLLKAEKLITLDEAKGFLGAFRIPAQAVSELRNVNLRRLNLRMGDD